jgi:hypothetical protein
LKVRTEVSFLVLVGIACTITVQHALCRTIPESYGRNKVSFLGLGQGLLVGPLHVAKVRIPWVRKDLFKPKRNSNQENMFVEFVLFRQGY